MATDEVMFHYDLADVGLGLSALPCVVAEMSAVLPDEDQTVIHITGASKAVTQVVGVPAGAAAAVPLLPGTTTANGTITPSAESTSREVALVPQDKAIGASSGRPAPLGGPEFIPISVGDEAPASAGRPGRATAHQQRQEVASGDDSAEDAAIDALIEAAGKRPYWMRGLSCISSPFLRLHNEMVELCELLQATPEEEAARKAAVNQIGEVVKSIWPNAETVVFGSFATGLYVPTSDVDVVVLGADSDGGKVGSLKALANALTRKGVAQGMQVIAKAKVPIIKFATVDHGGLAVDVSFDVPNGPEAASMVKEFVREWPMMRPIILVLKLFLQQRELNEVYSGGIGSYALITMVTAFLKQHRSRFCKPEAVAASERAGRQQRDGGCEWDGEEYPSSHVEPNLAVLLVDFFRLYSRVINMHLVGIASSGGGFYFRKEDKDGQVWLQPERPHMLSVEDPKDPTNDISRGSFAIMRVKSAFEHAYAQLTAPSDPSESLLARVLRLGPILASRRRPAVGATHLPYCAPPAGRLPAAAIGGISPAVGSTAGTNRKRDREEGEADGEAAEDEQSRIRARTLTWPQVGPNAAPQINGQYQQGAIPGVGISYGSGAGVLPAPQHAGINVTHSQQGTPYSGGVVQPGTPFMAMGGSPVQGMQYGQYGQVMGGTPQYTMYGAQAPRNAGGAASALQPAASFPGASTSALQPAASFPGAFALPGPRQFAFSPALASPVTGPGGFPGGVTWAQGTPPMMASPAQPSVSYQLGGSQMGVPVPPALNTPFMAGPVPGGVQYGGFGSAGHGGHVGGMQQYGGTGVGGTMTPGPLLAQTYSVDRFQVFQNPSGDGTYTVRPAVQMGGWQQHQLPTQPAYHQTGRYG